MSPPRGSRAGRFLAHPLPWIVALGTALRAYHLGWGLPAYNFPDDVMHFLRPAVRAAAGTSLLPDGFVHPPVFVGLLAAAFRLWGALTGQAIAPPTPAMTEQMAALTLVGRALNVALAAGTIAMTWAVARRLAGRRAALLAAAAVAFAPLHVLESHRLAPDVPALLLILVAGWLALAADERGSVRLLLASAAVAGVAAATRYTAGEAVAAPLWAAARAAPGTRGRRVVAAGAAAAAGFLVGCVPCLCRLDRFLADLRLIAILGYAIDAPGVTLTGDFPQQRWAYPLLVGLPYMLGWPLYLLGLAGLVVAWRRDRRAGSFLAALVVPYVLLVGASRAAVPRYYLPVLPFLAVAAAVAVTALAARRRALAWGAGVAAWGYTALLAGSQVWRLDLGPQRQVAALVDALAAGRDADRPLVVAYPSRVWLHYDAVRGAVRRPGVRLVEFPPPYGNPFVDEAGAPPPRAWLDEGGVEVVVLPSWVEHGVMRARPEGLAGRFFEALGTGALGFAPAGWFRRSYLTERLYTWGDPMLDTHWETAIAGYRVFVRRDDGG